MKQIKKLLIEIIESEKDVDEFLEDFINITTNLNLVNILSKRSVEDFLRGFIHGKGDKSEM